MERSEQKDLAGRPCAHYLNPTYSPTKPIVQKVNTAVQTISLHTTAVLYILGTSLLFDILAMAQHDLSVT